MDTLGVALDAIQLQVLGRHNQICHLKAANTEAFVPSGSLLIISSNGGREPRWVAVRVKM